MKDHFISEPLQPVSGELEIAHAASGEPALPRKFTWRGEVIEIAEVARRWKSAGDCTHRSGERYVRRHWFDIVTVDGRRLRIYFDRQAQSRAQRKKRWWVYSEMKQGTTAVPDAGWRRRT